MIAPLRAQAEKAAQDARWALDQLPTEWQVSMGFDAALRAVETWQGAGIVANDARQELADLNQRRNGWDTLPPADRNAVASELHRIMVVFDRLAKAVAAVERAEREEIEALRRESRALSSGLSTLNCAERALA